MVEMPSNDCIMIVAIGKHVQMMFFIRNSYTDSHGFLLVLCLEKISSRVSNLGPTGSYRIRRYIPTTYAISA
jgi:hypothetical protein